MHDSKAVDHLLMPGNTGSGVWADAAYRSDEMETRLRDHKGTSKNCPDLAVTV